MAWCPHCKTDRPITRRIFSENCPICEGKNRHEKGEHMSECRGPAPHALDVCTFCNTSVFCYAKNEQEYLEMEKEEQNALCPKTPYNASPDDTPERVAVFLLVGLIVLSILDTLVRQYLH